MQISIPQSLTKQNFLRHVSCNESIYPGCVPLQKLANFRRLVNLKLKRVKSRFIFSVLFGTSRDLQKDILRNAPIKNEELIIINTHSKEPRQSLLTYSVSTTGK